MAAKSYDKNKKKSGGGNNKPDFKKRKFDANNKHHDDKSTPSNKKRALKAERQSHRKHATTVRSAKEIWNELRVKTNDKETNTKLCTELHGLLQGKCMEVAMQHDASRCVQGVLQFGTEEQRREVVMELCNAGEGGSSSKKDDKNKQQQNVNLAELCKIQYAHFVVLKMIKYCGRDDACVRLIVKSLKKQMTKLAVHSVGSRVVELLFATFPTKSTAPLKLELYGPQYALFASAIPPSKDAKNAAAPALPTLSAFIESNPDKLEPTKEHLQNLLQKGLDKSLTGFAYFHSLLLDYTSVASPNDIRSFLTPALSEHALHLLSTRAGTKVVCECIAYGTVKDRKKMIKCLKGYTRSSLLHRDAYLAVLRMCDVMDDTVLVNKMLLAELHKNPEANKGGDGDEEMEDEDSPILDLALSDTGSKLFLLLLVSKEDDEDEEDDNADNERKGGNSSRWVKYIDPYELAVLHRNPSVTENGESVPTSKKEDETRRQELVVYLKDLLVEVCVKHTEELMKSKPGSRVLMEVCEAFGSEELFSAIVEACTEDGGEMEDDDDLPIVQDAVGHLTLKHLFLSESKKELDDGEPSLARMFCDHFKDKLGEIASSNRGAFVLSALIQNSCVKEDVKDALKSHQKEIAKLAKGSGKDKKKLAGCGVLLEALKA
jgi:pumilio family protein 6